MSDTPDDPETFDPTQPCKLPRHEAFAAARAGGKTFMDALHAAGYKSASPGPGVRLAAMPEIAARIRHLMNEAKNRRDSDAEARRQARDKDFDISIVTVDYLVKEALTNLETARAEGNYKDSNEAIKLVAALLGYGAKMKDPQKGSQLADDPTKNRPDQQINIQVLNQVADRMDRAARNESEAEQNDPAESAGNVVGALSDQRSSQPAFSIVRPAVQDIEPVPRIAPVPRD